MTPLTIIILVLGLIGCFVCGFMSEDLHRRKGYEGGFWLGFLLGIAGLVYSAGLPDIRAKKVTRRRTKRRLRRNRGPPRIIRSPLRRNRNDFFQNHDRQ